ncbi:hypothetical protein ADMFC3_19170 [Geovibrio sp. ADMFC3]
MYFRKKQVIDDQLKIDIRDLRKKGFKYGEEFSGTVSITSNGITKGAFAFLIDESKLTLIYFYRGNHSNLEAIRQEVKLHRLECHYGGLRVYFVCPKCGKKIMALYLGDKYFYCRSCCNLAHKSQQIDKASRLLNKLRKIRRKLNTPDDLFSMVWHKPKGMHHKTFYRLTEESNAVTNEYFKQFLP